MARRTHHETLVAAGWTASNLGRAYTRTVDGLHLWIALGRRPDAWMWTVRAAYVTPLAQGKGLPNRLQAAFAATAAAAAAQKAKGVTP